MAQDYEVTAVRTSTRVSETGELVDFYEVYFTTSAGDSSYVRVPRTATADEMIEAVETEARKLLALRGM